MNYTDIDYIFNYIPSDLREHIGDDNFIFIEANKALGKITGAYKYRTVFNEEFTVTNHILPFNYDIEAIYIYNDDAEKYYLERVSTPLNANQYTYKDGIITLYMKELTFYMDYNVYTKEIVKDVDELWEYLVHMVAAAHWEKRAYFKEPNAVQMAEREKRLAYQKRLAALRKITPFRKTTLQKNLYR